MTLRIALSKIRAPKGATTLISGVLSGDMDGCEGQDAKGFTLEQAEARLGVIAEDQRRCSSDAAYWGYEGDRSYWSAVVWILKAAKLVGPENLPEVRVPRLEGLVMDVCAYVEDYGRRVYEAAVEACGQPKGEGQ